MHQHVQVGRHQNPQLTGAHGVDTPRGVELDLAQVQHAPAEAQAIGRVESAAEVGDQIPRPRRRAGWPAIRRSRSGRRSPGSAAGSASRAYGAGPGRRSGRARRCRPPSRSRPGSRCPRSHRPSPARRSSRPAHPGWPSAPAPPVADDDASAAGTRRSTPASRAPNRRAGDRARSRTAARDAGPLGVASGRRPTLPAGGVAPDNATTRITTAMITGKNGHGAHQLNSSAHPTNTDAGDQPERDVAAAHLAHDPVERGVGGRRRESRPRRAGRRRCRRRRRTRSTANNTRNSTGSRPKYSPRPPRHPGGDPVGGCCGGSRASAAGPCWRRGRGGEVGRCHGINSLLDPAAADPGRP